MRDRTGAGATRWHLPSAKASCPYPSPMPICRLPCRRAGWGDRQGGDGDDSDDNKHQVNNNRHGYGLLGRHARRRRITGSPPAHLIPHLALGTTTAPDLTAVRPTPPRNSPATTVNNNSSLVYHKAT
ncbi:hypothetical protein DHEL01_v202707 [Diaporthe helianthi]|uniref:Uncharacterized protein n=1 Tax=Diaporthe helianthi TaxID=158607 RepID=A0A2P5I8R6_DIAHE|nr:hypothetical protein DHEL01_v202707 [Diaporthe helianthi]